MYMIFFMCTIDSERGAPLLQRRLQQIICARAV